MSLALNPPQNSRLKIIIHELKEALNPAQILHRELGDLYTRIALNLVLARHVRIGTVAANIFCHVPQLVARVLSISPVRIFYARVRIAKFSTVPILIGAIIYPDVDVRRSIPQRRDLSYTSRLLVRHLVTNQSTTGQLITPQPQQQQ